MTEPCLIVFGALRSGTTMLRLMIDSHPGLSCTGEHDFLFDHLRKTGDAWTYDREAMADDRIFRSSGVTLPIGLDGIEALRQMIDQIGEIGGGPPVRMVHRHLGRVVELLPNVPFVHFLRDPRDVARSAIGMMWAGNVWFGAETWLRSEQDWERHGKGLAERTSILKYESLVAEPGKELARLCLHAGVAFDPGMLEYHRSTTYEAPDPSLAYQWRRKLSQQDIQLIEARVGHLLADRGYETSGLPPLTPSHALRLRLALQNRWSIWKRIIATYGLIDPLQRGVGRRLGLPQLARPAQLRMDRITSRRLK